MRSASIRRMREKREKYAKCVYMHVRSWETEREKLSDQQREGENDRRGRRRGKERLRKTTPERLRAEPAAPSRASSSSLPVCFAMVTRQGSQCSQLMCFSAAGASWVLMCLSLSPAQSMSTVLGCTNTWRAWSQGTLSRPGWVSGPGSERGPRHLKAAGSGVFRKMEQWWGCICVCLNPTSHVDHHHIDLKCLNRIQFLTGRVKMYPGRHQAAK